MDTHLLIANIDEDSGNGLQDFMDTFARLDNGKRTALCKDHVFYGWLNELKSMALAAYEPGGHRPNAVRIAAILGLLHLAVAAITKTELKFEIAPLTRRKVLLPVTGLMFEYPPDCDDGLVTCHYYPRNSELVIGNAMLTLSAFSEHRSVKVVNDHFDFFADPSGDEYGIEFDDTIDSAAWTESVARAMSIVDTDVIAGGLVSSFVSYVVPLRQQHARTNLSFSARNLPNVVFKNNELTPYLVGETLVHEADHQFFYALETIDDLWHSSAQRQAPVFFSPWRDDPRPLDGILRGLSAFARVAGYYSSVLTFVSLQQQEAELIGAILLRRIKQSEVALATVAQSGQLSEFGTHYLDDISTTLAESDRAARALGQYDAWRRKATDTVEAHRVRWNELNR